MRKKLTPLNSVTLITIILVLIFFLVTWLNRAYYPGFERSLDYFSPNLSESRTILRDRVELDRPSEVKLVFELKNSTISYERSQFYSFIDDLVVQVWNDQEFIEFKPEGISYNLNGKSPVIIDIGRLKGRGEYKIYINSNYGVNYTYNIGIGIGRGLDRDPVSSNRRSFF